MTTHSRNAGAEPDLFDVVAAEEAPDVVHMVLPHFATGVDWTS